MLFKFELFIGILFFLLTGCKKEIQSNKKQEPIAKQEMVVQKKMASKNQDSIRVFHASFSDNNVQNKTEKISILTKRIQSHFVEYPFESTSNELEESKEGYREKSFLKTLSRDFKNKGFLDVSSLLFIIPMWYPIIILNQAI